jgi:hypothetical protein
MDESFDQQLLDAEISLLMEVSEEESPNIGHSVDMDSMTDLLQRKPESSVCRGSEHAYGFATNFTQSIQGKADDI